MTVTAGENPSGRIQESDPTATVAAVAPRLTAKPGCLRVGPGDLGRRRQWVSTHRDDCGKLFAYAALRPSTYGKAYNATRQQHTTWSQYYRQVSAALEREAQLIYMPRDWIVRRDPKRFGLLKEITGFHGAYDSAAARRDVPEFVCDIDLTAGAAEVFADQRRQGKWKDSRADSAYQAMAVHLGQEPQPA